MTAEEHQELLEREAVPTDPAGRYSYHAARILTDVLEQLEQLEQVDTEPDRPGLLRRFWRWLW